MWQTFKNIPGRLLTLLDDNQLMPLSKSPGRKPLQDFFDRYSLANLLPYEAYDEATNLYLNKKSVGFILEAHPLTGANEETVNILCSLLTDVLPSHADCQILLWGSDKVLPILERFQSFRSKRGELYRWLAKKRSDYLKQGIYHSLSRHQSYVIRDIQLFLVVSFPQKNGHDNTEECLQIRDAFKSSLNSIGLPSKDMTITRFMSVMQSWLNPSFNPSPYTPRWDIHNTLSSQLTLPDYDCRVFPNHLQFQGRNDTVDVRSLTVTEYPESSAQWKVSENIGQLFNDALQIPCPFLVSFSLRVIDKEKAKGLAQLKFMNKDSTVTSPLAKLNPKIGKEYQDWAFVRERLSEGDGLVKTYYQILLFNSPEEAPIAERKVCDCYRANGWHLRNVAYLQLQSFLAALPMMMTEGLYEDFKQLGRLKTMTVFNAVNVAPLQGDFKGTKSPALLLPSRRGQLATWNPFDSEEGNFNVAIAAKSGSGKSAFTQEYLVALLGSGARVWVIDVGRSYEKTCQLLGGEFIEFTPDTDISLNPFSFITDIDESLPLLKPLLSTMARPDEKASAEEVAFLEQAIKAAFSQKGNDASITTVADWLEKQTSPICQTLSHLLYSYTKKGMYGRYFEGKCSIQMDNPLVVLELQELKVKKDLQKIVLLVLMYQIHEAMVLGDRAQIKSCIIDEAWDLLSGNLSSAAEFIEVGYRTARRFRGNFVTITQSINDYFKNDTALAAYENSDHNIILAQKNEAITKLNTSGQLEMDGFTERLYKSLRKTDEYSECIIKGPQGLSVHRIVFDPYSMLLYSSKGEEFATLKALQAEGLPLKEAIEQVVLSQKRRAYG